ncbi:electron transfer flavoprotein subunit alpha/FixB family protein [Methylocella sp.]|uniref:electron transfer flavoprotein subunit alpha/FixB family protein n=1 Tax=Methylocella sp. TaxID=1978226 RepID=UPI003784F671
MTTLLLADHDDAALNEATARALAGARALGGEVHVLVCGAACRPAAEAAARLSGAAKILLAEDPALAHRLSEPVAALILALAPAYDAIVAPATSLGKSALPRVAALLDVAQVSEATKILAPDMFERPIYAGAAIEVVRSAEPKLVATLRASAFAPAPEAAAPAPIETVEAAPGTFRARFLGETLSKSERPELGAARVVVSGGRALGSQESFDEIILPLADALGAAVGASRAAVDAGYAPNDLQVGQTGKIVAPELYVAVGISGAIQHLAGMKDSKVIVAINKDEEAPIFQAADYGLVGDLFDLAPQLTKALDRP